MIYLSNKQKENLLMMVFVVSTVATAGSLFFSEIMKFEPCKLCWIQRIFMYPLPILTGITIIRKDYSQNIGFLFLASIGLIFSIYHNIYKLIPSDNVGSCGQISCRTDYFSFMGFITIPLLSLIAFSLIETLLIYLIVKEKKSNK